MHSDFGDAPKRLKKFLKDDTWLYRNPKQRRYPPALEASPKDPIATALSGTSRFLLEFVFSSAGLRGTFSINPADPVDHQRCVRAVAHVAFQL
jgi:hypothetical protein